MRQAIPALPEPAQLAGTWVIVAGERAVTVSLSTNPAEIGDIGAPAWVLGARSGALEALGLEPAIAWRPAPDGIALVAADGVTVVFFSADGAGRYTHQSGRGRLVLAKAAG